MPGQDRTALLDAVAKWERDGECGTQRWCQPGSATDVRLLAAHPAGSSAPPSATTGPPSATVASAASVTGPYTSSSADCRPPTAEDR
ncbi:hypothetical protein OG777_26740 [Micromonospora peucetia]|uniref:hypothetical protein n=1 Tax=Micromonospora peucetia TaxID=47871 RepID=UPI0022559014|nr:hypothetical protein [Micromonospora peucetia]MCX4390499.1 hypothetical protein [Micromonospora peucetia]